MKVSAWEQGMSITPHTFVVERLIEFRDSRPPIRNALCPDSRIRAFSFCGVLPSTKMAASAPAAPLPDDFYFSTLHMEQSMDASQCRQADTVATPSSRREPQEEAPG